MSQTVSPLDVEPKFSQIKKAIEEDGETNATIAKLFSTSESSVRRFRVRHNLNPKAIERAFVEIKGDKGVGATAPTTEKILDDPDTMLRQRGLDPEEWAITSLRANEYEGPNSAEAAERTGEAKIKYYQTRFNVERRRPPELQVFAPRTDGWIAPDAAGRYGSTQNDGSILCVVVGDQQAPYHDPVLHSLFTKWLAINKPDWGVSLGDSVDFPDISRHQLDPENTATVNECLQSGYDMFRGYIDASPETWWRKLIGNHDERLRNILLDKPKMQALYGIKRPDTEDEYGEGLLDLRHAMRLDELGIDVIDPHGKYDLGQIVLTPKLAVRHGWLARQGSGASSLATLKHLGYSVIVGHTHRQSVVHESKHEIDGRIRTLTGVESGCMCRVEQTVGEDGRIWPNYTPAPDWQQGFCTVRIWPDGFFNIDTAKYVNGVLMWRDERYSLND